MRPEAELDIECFHNWFLVGITDSATGTEWDFQMVPGNPLDVTSIEALLRHYTIVTFNGQNYDIPMLSLALKGVDNATLKAANDDIIRNQLKWWEFGRKYGAYPPDYLDHIDVSEPTPGVRVSLKQYACRIFRTFHVFRFLRRNTISPILKGLCALFRSWNVIKKPATFSGLFMGKYSFE